MLKCPDEEVQKRLLDIYQPEDVGLPLDQDDRLLFNYIKLLHIKLF